MQEQELICAIDCGTSGMKVALVALDGTVVHSTSRPYGVLHPRAGWIEQSVDTLWQAECEALNEVLDGIPPARLIATAISGQRATLVCQDEQGRPLGDYISWQDQRGLQQCEAIAESFGTDAFYRLSGLDVEPIASISKIRWLIENDPERSDETACFGANQTLMLRQLGVTQNLCSPSEASYFGLFDVEKRCWNPQLCELAGIAPDRLPKVIESGEPIGAISRAAAESTGLPEGLPIIMGGGDSQLVALGLGAAQPSGVGVVFGTGSVSFAYVAKPTFCDQRQINCLCHAVPGAWELEGLGRASGASFRWYRNMFGEAEIAQAKTEGRDAFDLLTKLAATAPAGSNGLLMIPALAGLGPPFNNPTFGGAFLGVRLRHSKPDTVRAVLEGMIYEQRIILETLTNLGAEPSELRVSGGVSKSDFACQMIADITGFRVRRTTEPDNALIGAAICAAVGAARFDSIEEAASEMVREDREWAPQATHANTYAAGFDAYATAINAIQSSGLSGKLAALRRIGDEENT